MTCGKAALTKSFLTVLTRYFQEQRGLCAFSLDDMQILCLVTNVRTTVTTAQLLGPKGEEEEEKQDERALLFNLPLGDTFGI